MMTLAYCNQLFVGSVVGCWTSCSHSGTPLLDFLLEPENLTASHLWCESFTGYQYDKDSSSREPFWCSNAFVDMLQCTCLNTASRQLTILAVHICDQPTRACCLFHGHKQPMATGVLPSVDQPRGTVYLWHCGQMMLQRPSEDIWRHSCWTLLTISCIQL